MANLMQKLLYTVLCPVMLVQAIGNFSSGIKINESMNNNVTGFISYVSN